MKSEILGRLDEEITILGGLLDRLKTVRKEIASEDVATTSIDDISTVQNVVAEVCGVKRSELIQKSRGDTEAADSRKLAMYLCFKLRLGSNSRIGFRFGGREPSTVSHAKKTIIPLIENETRFREYYNQCLKILNGTMRTKGLVKARR